MKKIEQEALSFFPTAEQLKQEAARLRYRRRFREKVQSTTQALITASAIAVLVAVLLLPVLRIYGTSMTPTLSEGNYVVSIRGGSYHSGDICAFYYNNKILVKRVIAYAGDWVDITEDGATYVNNVRLDEPYVSEPGLGECDIELPYQVPEGRVFVMGDHRSTSVDSRSTTIGCVSEEQMVGRIVFRLWPLSGFGKVK